jgi:hypothetical protein
VKLHDLASGVSKARDELSGQLITMRERSIPTHAAGEVKASPLLNESSPFGMKYTKGAALIQAAALAASLKRVRGRCYSSQPLRYSR